MDMTSVAATVAEILGVRHPFAARGEPLEDVVQGLGRRERLAVVVIDALGVATWKAHREVSPNVNALAGRHLLTLRSVAPPITPVNFATMVTGAPPEVHGVRQRTDELRVETLFHVLRQARRISATAGREQSTVGLLLSPLADRPHVDASNMDDRVRQLAEESLLEDPSLLLVQLLDVDDASHAFGPFSPQTQQALSASDRRLGELIPLLARRGYALLLLADHGQHEAGPEDDLPKRGTHNGRVEIDFYVPLVWATPEELSQHDPHGV